MFNNDSLEAAISAVSSSQICRSFIELGLLTTASDSFGDFGAGRSTASDSTHSQTIPNADTNRRATTHWRSVGCLLRHHQARRAQWRSLRVDVALLRMHMLYVLKESLMEVPPIISDAQQHFNGAWPCSPVSVVQIWQKHMVHNKTIHLFLAELYRQRFLLFHK